MPATLPREARLLRADLAQLTDLASNDLAIVWRDLRTPEDAEAALRDIVPGLVGVYGAAAGSLAADWYDDLRDARGVPRRFRAIVPEVPDPGAGALAGFAAGPLYQREPDWETALSKAAGGVQLRVANMSRATVTGSTAQDPQATGWQRVGGGSKTCEFCDMLIGRIYPAKTREFEAHDRDQCGAMPVWSA